MQRAEDTDRIDDIGEFREWDQNSRVAGGPVGDLILIEADADSGRGEPDGIEVGRVGEEAVGGRNW